MLGLLFLVTAAGSACALFHGSDPTSKYEAQRKCLRESPDKVKLGENFLVPSDGLGSVQACFATVFLRTFHEPDLRSRASTGPDTYRLLWLPTFDPPVSVRIQALDIGATLIVVVGSGAGGYEPGRVWRRDSIRLAPAEWARLERAVARSDFWQLPPRGGRGGLDGSDWIIEGVSPGRYRIVDQHSPDTLSTYFQLGYLMLVLSGLPMDSLRIY